MPDGRLAGTVRGLLSAIGAYASIGWWGLVSPRVSERGTLVVVQGVILGRDGILLSVRADLRGWELPGGTPEPGESNEQALRREILEETGIEVAVERHAGNYHRTGFRPHIARVYLCHPVGGELRTQREETRCVKWFEPKALPDTLFPWYRKPLADALVYPAVFAEADEHQGLGTILSAMAIDLRMRLSGDQAGLPEDVTDVRDVR
jgi:8-oxo-dGTP diphosphatase